jgi:DNA-binding MarR family transcriptional regulator
LAEVESAGRLVTVNERVLLHLREFALPRFRAEVPPQVTQEGIAEALGIRPNHVPRAVRRLISEGTVEELLSHVSGYARRRKAYFLTEKGLSIAEGVWRRVSAVQVDVALDDGHRSLSLQEAQYQLPGRPGITRILKAMGDDGIVRLGEEEQRPHLSHGFVDISSNVPRPPYFFGREKELADLQGWLAAERPKAIVVSGVKGIGKTALVHQALGAVRGKRHLFWHTFHPWDSPEALTSLLQQFLATVSKEGQKAELDPVTLPEALRERLPKLNAVVVLDNLYELREETANLCHHLVEVFAATAGAKLVVTTRNTGFYQRFRAYANLGAVAEIQLQGLDKESARMVVEANGGPVPDFDRVWAISSGHPMILELINSDEIKALVDDSGLSQEEALVLRCLKAFDVILG